MLDDGHFECRFADDRTGEQPHMVDWRFEVSGLHVGRTLNIWLCNVSLEYLDDGPGATASWSQMRWADDNTLLEDEAFLDGYGDALQPEVTAMLCERR